MAANIQTLIDLLGSQILKYDLSHIKGEEIVNGNPEHCINLLQLVQEIASMLDGNEDSQQDDGQDRHQVEDKKSDYTRMATNINNQQMEDEESQLIQERRQKQRRDENAEQQQRQPQSANKQSSNKRGRSYSDDRGKKNGFEDDIDISNEFNVNMDEDNEDDEDDDQELMMQQQQQNQHQQRLQQQQQQQQIMQEYGQEGEDDEDEEIDEDDLQMYEQFLANNKQQEQQLARIVDEKQSPVRQQQQQQQQQKQQIVQQEQEADDDDDDMELDYDDLDPQILEMAKQMGVHPKEIVKQIIKMQEEGYGDEDDEGQDEDNDEMQYVEEEKAIYVQQQNQKQQQQKPQQQSAKKTAKKLPHELIQQDSDQESYYSEGEVISRDKLAHRKAYSAPYIIMNYCFDEPLYDSEEENQLERANSTNILDNIYMQEQLAQNMQNAQGSDDDEEMDEETAQMILMQQQQMMQKQQKQNSKITEVSKSKESSNNHGRPPAQVSTAKKQQQQQQIYQQEEEDDEYEEADINVAQKLQQLKQEARDNGDDDGDEGEDDDDEDVMIDLDKLDETNKAMLLQYLQQEYQKNPDQFPYPKELIEEELMKHQLQQQQQQHQDTESVRDIRSDEMIVEDTSQRHQDGIHGGAHEIEDEDDDDQQLTDQQQQQLQLMLQQQQQQQQQQDYGEEDEGEELTEEQQQMLYQYQMQQQQQQQQQLKQLKPKFKKGVAKGTKGIRPKSAGRKKAQNVMTEEQVQQQMLLEQQQQLIQMIQNQEIDVENLDPNVLQQLIMAQSQQQQMMQQQQPPSRPRTAKRKTSATKPKKAPLAKLQPYYMPQRNQKVLGPSTPGTHFKSFNTNRSNNNQTLSKKKKSSKKRQQPMTGTSSQQYMEPVGIQQQQQQQYEMPVLSEDYLNQLSEEQLQYLLEHQQQLMMMQQQQQQQQSQTRSLRPKSAKSTIKQSKPKVPAQYNQYYQAQPYMNIRRKSTGKAKKKGKKKRAQAVIQDAGGVLMNNYFPALEGGGQSTEDGSLSKDSKYPKFSHDIVNNPSLLQQDAIHEVPQEQEEGESQEFAQGQNPNFYPQQEDDQVNQDQDQDIEQDGVDQDQDGQEEGDDQGFVISDEQLIQLIQNAHNLSPEQQQQLQMILQERMKGEMMNDRAKSYENIYHILMDNVRKAKDRLAYIGLPNGSIDDEGETDRRILRQKQEFEALYRQYNMESKQRQTKKVVDQTKDSQKVLREQKIQAIKERKFQDELQNHQKSLNFKRNAQQVRLCQKVYKLASDLEKNKLLAEKKEFKETVQKKKQQSKQMVDAMENFYKNMVGMLKDKIENERFERKIAGQAQQQAISRMKRELNNQKKQEVDRYLQLLKQEDQRYDFESTNVQKIEQEILKLYKK